MIYICTAQVGNYDFLSNHVWIKKYKNIKLICFTDQNKVHKSWNKIGLPKNITHLSNFLKHKYVKLFCDKILNKKGLYVWVDANIYVKETILELIESFEKSDSDLLFVKHPSRTNPEEEYKFLIAQKFKNENTVKNILKLQFEHYEKNIANYKKFNLIEANFFIKKNNNKKINQLFATWWNEIKYYPARDQLSLPYVLSKYDLKYMLLDIGNRENNYYFNHYGHKVHNFNDIHSYLFSRRHLIIFRLLILFWTPIHKIKIYTEKIFFSKLSNKYF